MPDVVQISEPPVDGVSGELPEDAPDLLYAMQKVSMGESLPGPLAKACLGWLQEKPVAFMEKLASLEATYWSGKRPGGGSWDGAGPCPTCKRLAEGVDEGSERSLGAARLLLEGL